MDNYDPLKIENQLCFPLYAASREVVRKYKPYLDKLGLTYTQYITMMVLWEHKSLNVKTIGEMLHLDSGTLTPLLKKLETSGFIRRKRNQDDERSVIIELTEQGMALKEQAKDIPGQMSCEIKLTPQEAGTLYELLYKVIGNE